MAHDSSHLFVGARVESAGSSNAGVVTQIIRRFAHDPIGKGDTVYVRWSGQLHSDRVLNPKNLRVIKEPNHASRS